MGAPCLVVHESVKGEDSNEALFEKTLDYKCLHYGDISAFPLRKGNLNYDDFILNNQFSLL